MKRCSDDERRMITRYVIQFHLTRFRAPRFPPNVLIIIDIATPYATRIFHMRHEITYRTLVFFLFRCDIWHLPTEQ